MSTTRRCGTGREERQKPGERFFRELIFGHKKAARIPDGIQTANVIQVHYSTKGRYMADKLVGKYEDLYEDALRHGVVKRRI